MMSDINSDPLRVKCNKLCCTYLHGDIPPAPKSATLMAFEWKAIVARLYELEQACMSMERANFDLAELIGRQSKKIEEWVGVAEETG